MSNYNQNQKGDFQISKKYQDNNMNNQNNQNYPKAQYPPQPQYNVNGLTTEQLLVNTQKQMPNNNKNYTFQTPDIYPSLSDQVAPPILNHDIVMDQQTSQPPAQPVFQAEVQQTPSNESIPIDNAPLIMPTPMQPRRRSSVQVMTMLGFIASIISFIIISLRNNTKK